MTIATNARGNIMKTKLWKAAICSLSAMALCVIALSGSPEAQAAEPVLAHDCAAEIKTYCAKVTPGADRVVACLIGYEDKISARCRLTAYLSSGALDDRLKSLRSMAKICSADILQYCSNVPAGGGRVYDCLKKHQATLTDECRKNVPQFEKVMLD